MSGKSINFSVELFPPTTTAGRENLRETIDALRAVGPRFFSVTFGASGFSTQHLTTSLVSELIENEIETAPHISCLNLTKAGVDDLLQAYRFQKIKRLVVIRGDDPTNTSDVKRVFPNAVDLVRYIRETTGQAFEIFVAAYPEFHPESKTSDEEFQHLKLKSDAGANAAITQYFFSSEAYERYLENCERWHIRTPIIPGIMPIMQYDKLERFSKRCGAEIPRWLSKRLQTYQQSPVSLVEFGIDVVTKLCEDVIALGAPNLHFYTLNSAEICTRLVRNLADCLVDASQLSSPALVF